MTNSEKPTRAALATVLVLVACLYVPTLGYDFVNVDDPVNILDNVFLHPPSRVLALWTRSFQHLFVPLSYTVWAAVMAAFGESAAAFHAVNVLVFLVAIVLVFSILRELVRDDLGALAGAALFALHPAQVESVAWVTSLKGLLSGTLALAALRTALTDRWRKTALLLYTAALLAKTTALVSPFFLAAIRIGWQKRGLREAARELAPWLALGAAFGLVAVAVYPERNPLLPDQTFFDRLVLTLDAYALYLRHILWPFGLTIDSGWSAARLLGSGTRFFLAAIALVAFIAPRFAHRYRRELLTGGAIFVAGLLPTSGIKPHDMQVLTVTCERYLFLPLAGVALVFAAWCARVRAWRPSWAIGSAALIVCFVQSARLIPVWRDSFTLWAHVLEHNPRSWFAYNNLGSAFEKLKDYDRAAESYRAAVGIQPSNFVFNNLGIAELYRHRPADALTAFSAGLGLAPDDPLLLYNFRTAWNTTPPAQRPTELEKLAQRALAVDRAPAGASLLEVH